MSTMTEDKTYNGWANYETWCVNLWIMNDEGTYQAAVELASAPIPLDVELAKVMSKSERIRYTIAERFKSWVCDDLAPDLGATFAADLLNSALSEVDWYEIADSWLEQVTH